MPIAFAIVYGIVIGILSLGFRQEFKEAKKHPGYGDVIAFRSAHQSYMKLEDK